MSAARKYNDSRRSMTPKERNGAYAALNIMWKAIAAQFGCFSTSDMREARLEWIADFLELKHELKSASDLSDEQLRQVLAELRRLTGEPEKTRHNAPKSQPRGDRADFATSDERQKQAQPAGAVLADNVIQFPIGAARRRDSGASGEIEHLSANRASAEQKYSLYILLHEIGWTEEAKMDFFSKRKFPTDFSRITFKKAHSLMMLLLNIAAHKDLKSKGLPTGRKQTVAHIKVIKRRLNIDQ